MLGTRRREHTCAVAAQAKLSPTDFAALKSITRSLEGGWTTAQEYHDRVVCLGLAADVVQLMSTCPAAAARDAVLTVHADYINNGAPLHGLSRRLCNPAALSQEVVR